MLSQLYGNQSILLWNGNPQQGAQAINEFYQKFPTCKHEITSYDAQPLFQFNQMSVVVHIHGSVSHAGEKSINFTQVFILIKEENTQYVIGSDVFRFV
jgi:hypothetical protein